MNDEIRDSIEIGEIFDIEDAMLKIKQSQDRIEYYKELKRRRTQSLTESIKEEENKVESIKSAIQSRMEQDKEKSLKFPGIGTVSLKTYKGTWVIDDSHAIAKRLQTDGLFDDCGTVEINYNKTKLNKILSEYEKNKNVPEGTHRGEDSTSLTLSFEKESDQFLGKFDVDSFTVRDINADDDSSTAPIQQLNMDQFDSIKL